ncbi:hypothetical protein CTI12_AA108200 [Artemisia annua]|uniref:Uncharacterized protein n=1 Tax=Artemisia annua TaxID=35608 RepID=A0A2U1PUS8_ARTAN|nr:hypothetical protein CTI12_AA108200 [Artemisia annua]
MAVTCLYGGLKRVSRASNFDEHGDRIWRVAKDTVLDSVKSKDLYAIYYLNATLIFTDKTVALWESTI